MREKFKSTKIVAIAVSVAVAVPAAALAAGSIPKDEGRMTGGGVFKRSTGLKVTHGFSLRCPKTKGPNRLQINWEGNRFHLERLDWIQCTDGMAFDEGQPEAGFDTYRGKGVGRYNGTSGATIDFRFNDDGEPGTSDRGRILIKDASGATVLEITDRRLHDGTHQAHAGN